MPTLSIEEIRNRVQQIPEDVVDVAALRRVQLTEADYERWQRDQDARDIAEHERDRAELEAEIRAYAATLSLNQARNIITRAEEIDRHTRGCNLDVAQCETCAPLESEPGGVDEVSVPAAYQRLAAKTDY